MAEATRLKTVPSSKPRALRRREHPLNCLTAILRLDSSSDQQVSLSHAVEAGRIDWQATAELAQQHLLMPALWPALLEKNLVAALPDAMRRFLLERARAGGGAHYRLVLEASYRENAARNAAIRTQATAAIGALDAAGIEVALLKGSRTVLEEQTPFSQGRVLRDIDLLVRAEKWGMAGSVLEGAGYRKVGKAPHAITYAPVRDGVEIDLHREPLWLHKPVPLPDFLTADGFWHRATLVEKDGLSWYCLPPTESLIHSILHTEVADLNHAAGDWALRYLHETAVISRRMAGVFDLSVLESVQGCGLGPPLLAHLCAARRLFGALLPALIEEDWPARRHFQRCRINARYPRSVRRVSILVYKLRQAMAPWYLARKGFYVEQEGASFRPGALWRARLNSLTTLLRRHIRRLPLLLFSSDDSGIPPPRV